ncbi:hypothetical protein EYV94_23670 [Puteibacter caeruleilacunae]|nr:hypothetical protein EYV94_23670 [Puteibacter caeruleilacunae]
MVKQLKASILFIIIVILVSGCASYYDKNIQFNNYFSSGQIEQAKATLIASEKKVKPKDQLLYNLNQGVVNRMTNNFEESIDYFNKADLMVEDYRKGFGTEALALISNPMMRPYKAEDFEGIMIHYYQALNYLEIGKYDEAIVECKRINIQLNALNDKYKDHKNKYQQDAFAHLLMGLIYDAQKDYNNAFIAYRNALEVYESDYAKNFGILAPIQLKKDLLRSAARIGFTQELQEYENKFGMKYETSGAEDSELVFFWLNGVGPVKEEWSVNFSMVAGEAGWVVFENDDLGWSFPLYVGDLGRDEQRGLEDLSFVRVAFPKFVERIPVFQQAQVECDSLIYDLEVAQDINAVAFKSLKDRMLREMANSLLRLAVKQGMEHLARKESDGLGFIVSLANAMTEKADTRNWQTLPHTIFYSRIPVAAGKDRLNLSVSGGHGVETYDIPINVQKGETRFMSFHNQESQPLPNH